MQKGSDDKIRWVSDNEFILKNVRFKMALSDLDNLITTPEQIAMIKDRGSLALYDMVLSQVAITNVLEFGIYEGGSPVYFSLKYDLAKFVGIDIRNSVRDLDQFLSTHPIGERIHIHYAVSQDDEPGIRKIIDLEFGENDIDLIIDDASHQYELTRRTFEIAFPYLKPGGIYAIEDWGWAHWKGFDYWPEATAMSNLIFELIMVSASHPEMISEIRVFPAFAFITKSPICEGTKDIELDKLYDTKGRQLNLI